VYDNYDLTGSFMVRTNKEAKRNSHRIF